MPVDRCLADQLLVPFALAGGGAFRTLAPALHTATNVDVIRRFLDVDVALEPAEQRVCTITVAARARARAG